MNNKLREAARKWIELYSGEIATNESVEEIASEFKVDTEELKKEILRIGIEESWLIDEYFQSE